MKRTIAYKPKEKKQRKRDIIAAARKVFSTKGFNTTTMEDIAFEVKLSPSTLYLYFKSKQDLHTFLYTETLGLFSGKIQSVVGMNISVEAKIEKLCDVLIEMHDYDFNVFLNLFNLQSRETLNNLSNEVLHLLRENLVLTHGAITDLMKDGIKQGIFIDENPTALADVLWSSYAGVVFCVNSKRLLHNQKNFVKTTLSTTSRVMIKGLKQH